MENQIQGRDIREFILGGMATFTIRSRVARNQFTYRVKLAPRRGVNNERPYFVSVLHGKRNDGDYTYLGCIWEPSRFVHDRDSRISPSAISTKAFRWFWNKLSETDPDLTEVEFYHAGACARCGKLLTDPESIERGWGPVCAKLRT